MVTFGKIKVGLSATVALLAFLTVLPGEAHPRLTPSDVCASCGMTVTKYPGPKGLLVGKNGSHRAFCSARALACEVLVSGGAGRALVHDAGKTGWEQPEDSAFVAAESAWYVYASNRKAVMGPSLAPFSLESEARAFQKKYGGMVYRFDELATDILGCRAHN